MHTIYFIFGGERNTLEDEKANVGIIISLVGIGVGILALAIIFTIGPVIGYNVESANTVPSVATATGTFIFSGNVSNGELANITNGASVYIFEFNTTGTSPGNVCLTNNCIRINLTTGYNTSVLASGNLTDAINANTSTSALVTAVNTTNKTTLTAVNSGKAANSYSLSDNAVNIASSGLSGGVDGSYWSSINQPAITNGSELWAQDTPLMASAAIVAIAAVIIGVLLSALMLHRP